VRDYKVALGATTLEADKAVKTTCAAGILREVLPAVR